MELYPPSFQLKLFKRDANDARTLLYRAQSNKQIQGNECKRSRGFYVKLTPVQQAQITTASTENDTSHMVPNSHRTPAPSRS